MLCTDLYRVTDRPRLVLTADDASRRVRLHDTFTVYCANGIEFFREGYFVFVVALSLACCTSRSVRDRVGNIVSLNENGRRDTAARHMTKERTRRIPAR